MDAELTTTEFQEAWAIVHSGSWSYLDEAAHRVATAATRKALWADVALVEKMNRNGTVTAHVDGHDVVLSEYMRDCLLAAGIAPWEAPDA